ncbi:serine hydrolase domain-containing protein [Roseibacillus ishigakijimensis]|uniref:Beta-lactamase family protein n=1 Tax=Roseibacillus ishigakijimensis TaxID=454146 RepID=A0A934RPK3_9BACT|nr:serine hydrolase domain-containing protein [Roseibacillus ishigakijimensis]MBK1833143.1 beta-lactamase family protein [Roseibacillus ishigakijimensis]
MMKRLFTVGAALFLSGPIFGKNEKIITAMEEQMAAGEMAGVVTLVGGREGTRHLAAQGWANREEQREMKPDDLFWIASMTKPVTGVAVMMLVEDGQVSLDDPISKYCPEFAELKNAEGEKREVTLRQCLNHTAGLSELNGQEQGRISKLHELTALVAQKPLQFEPGSRWQYSQTGINTAGRVVEVVSGVELPEFFEKRIFAPLGMGDTTFYPSQEQQKRLATSYRKEGEELLASEIHFLRGKPLEDESRLPLANGGLFSTAEDYGQFARCLLRGGELDGERLLKEESVETLRTVNTGDLAVGFTPGNGWAVGCCVIREPQGVSESLSPGTYGHGGAYGTQAWFDPVAGNYQLLFVQRANFPNSDDSPVRKALHAAAAQ